MFMDCFPKKEDWPEQGIKCLSKEGFSKANGPILPVEGYYGVSAGWTVLKGLRKARRVAEVMTIDIDQVTAFGKSPQTVKARSL
jgi:hypothetical protein